MTKLIKLTGEGHYGLVPKYFVVSHIVSWWRSSHPDESDGSSAIVTADGQIFGVKETAEEIAKLMEAVQE